jgi:hypothetical protein
MSSTSASKITKAHYQRKRCVTEHCKGFAVNKLPLTGTPTTHCKKCMGGAEKALKKVEVEESSECILCCEPYQTKTCKFVLSCCKQACCIRCIVKAASTTCPFCRQEFKAKEGIMHAIGREKQAAVQQRQLERERQDRAIAEELRAAVQREARNAERQREARRQEMESLMAYHRQEVLRHTSPSIHGFLERQFDEMLDAQLEAYEEAEMEIIQALIGDMTSGLVLFN